MFSNACTFTGLVNSYELHSFINTHSVVWVVPSTLTSFSIVSLRYIDSTGSSVYTNSLGISLDLFGCTDDMACNYDSTATCDDGSCAYPTSSTTIDTVCNSYTWNGSTYTQSGIYTYTITGGTPSGTVSSMSYCTSNPNINFILQSATIIEDVQLVGDNFNIDNSTSGINDFYEDYTATMYADITEGETYTVDVIANDLSSVSGTYAPEAINVYIDFNIDGDFDDLGEDLGEISIPYGTWISGTVYSFNVTVPSTGVYGATRMRVVTMSNAGGGVNMGPCESPTGFNTPWFGATEDYSVVLNALTVCDSTATLDLTIINPDTLFTNFIVCDDSVIWNGITYTQSGIYTNTITGGTPSGTVSSMSYCTSNPNNTFIAQDATIIEDVQLVGDNFNIDNSTSGINDFYEDYTATMYADITEGQTYTVEVITNDLSSASGTYAPEAINVYIDFNIDGDFDDLGEDLGEISIPYGTWISGTVYSFNVTVPSTGVYGATRMRVVTMSNAGGGVTMGPCESPTGFNTPWFGATEDYSIVLSDPSLCDSIAILDLTINNSVFVSDTQSICFGQSISVGSSIYTTAGIYTDSLQTINGCDSVIITNLSIDPIGCTDTLACNYDSTATCDDGSCIMPDGCTDLTACNYDSTATCDDGSCVLPDGCTDNLACNYDSTATCDDGSCVYPTSSTTIETACDSYSWNGSTYTQSGIYSYVISLNSSGIVSTLSYCSSNPNLNISAGYSIIEDVQLVGDNFNIDNSTSGINDFYEDYTATIQQILLKDKLILLK